MPFLTERLLKAATTLLALLLLISFTLVGCSNFSDDTVGVLSGREVVDKRAARHMIRSGLMLNMARCSEENSEAVAYAIEEVVPRAITRSHYDADSIRDCQALIVASHCGPIGLPRELWMMSYFQQLLTWCNPRPVDL